MVILYGGSNYLHMDLSILGKRPGTGSAGSLISEKDYVAPSSVLEL